MVNLFDLVGIIGSKGLVVGANEDIDADDNIFSVWIRTSDFKFGNSELTPSFSFNASVDVINLTGNSS